MDCQFCNILRNSIGRFVVIGIVVNCASDDVSYNHYYNYGFIQRESFNNNNFKLFYSPTCGQVKFVGCCDDIFEIYFPEAPATGVTDVATFDLEKFMQQKSNLYASLSVKLQKEEKEDE